MAGPRENAIKKEATARLIREGRGTAFGEYVKRLLGLEVNADIAWKIALFAYSPLNGDRNELMDLPVFAEIARDWTDGKYLAFGEPPGRFKFPAGLDDVEFVRPSKAVQQAAKHANGAPTRKVRSYADLEALVPPEKTATEEQIMDWAFKMGNRRPEDIDPNSIPCQGATRFLQWVHERYDSFVPKWLERMKKSTGVDELSDDCRTHLERCEMYEAFLQGERETPFPDAATEAAVKAAEEDPT